METLTPETKEVKYAGFWLRFVAYLIDDLILGVVSFLVAIPFIGGIIFSAISLSDTSEFDIGSATGIAGIVGSIIGLLITTILVNWLYFAIMESSKTQGTLGKMALSLKVTDLDGNRISFGRATGRYFGKIISVMIFYIGFILAGFTEKKQALHDMMAACLVIRD